MLLKVAVKGGIVMFFSIVNKVRFGMPMLDGQKNMSPYVDVGESVVDVEIIGKVVVARVAW